MKIAILADVHGNLQALRAVMDHVDRWRPDAVLVAGDIVNRGPRSPECWDLVEERRARDGWLVIRGNHEEYVMQRGSPDAARPPPAYDVFAAVDWCRRSLGARAAELPAMVTEASLPTPAGEVFMTHGTLLGSRDGIYPHTTDQELDSKVRAGSAVFAVGHTHRPLIRRHRGCLVVNAGSIGMPFDGDPRAAYARLELIGSTGWGVRIVRLDYDRAAAERDFALTGFLDGCGPIGRTVLNEFRTARGRLAAWTRDYQDRILARELTVADAAKLFLSGIRG
ncbi:MAG: metallophosphoesterase family protein [Spirochaetaceae bacterium]|nr:metallophosphoesterase family protein [Spirochaetaceae bacterium]